MQLARWLACLVPVLLAGCVGPVVPTPTAAPALPRPTQLTTAPSTDRSAATAVVVVRSDSRGGPSGAPGMPGSEAGHRGSAPAPRAPDLGDGSAAGASPPELSVDDPLAGMDAVGVPAPGGAPIAARPQRPIGPVQPPVVAPVRPTPAPLRAATPTPPLPTTALAPAAPTIDRGRFVPPIVRNGQRKWGVGVYKDSNRVLEVLGRTDPGVILLMDPPIGWAKRVRAQHPDAFIVGRRFLPDSEQRLDRPDERGAAFADHVAELAVPLKGVVDAWMSYNEVLGSTRSSAYADYNRFQVAFARRLQNTHGVAAVAGNDGPGALQPEDYARYFAEAVRESEFFGLHAYPPSRAPFMQLDAEYYALRHRLIHGALERVGIRGKRMVITESGLAEGFQRDGITDEAYAEGMAWFTRELQRDPYVIGHAVFGLFDATGSWTDHDITESALIDLLPRLLRRG